MDVCGQTPVDLTCVDSIISHSLSVSHVRSPGLRDRAIVITLHLEARS